MNLARRLLDIIRSEKVTAPPAARTDQEDSGRHRLPDRRPAIRHRMKWQDSRGTDHVADVAFGFSSEGAIREVFCIAHKDGTDMQGIVHDACIAASIALQHGASITELARSFSELREEDQATGRPASIIGALARLGVTVEMQVQGVRA